MGLLKMGQIDKLSNIKRRGADVLLKDLMASMRDEMSKIAEAIVSERAKTAFATQPISTKPIDTSNSAMGSKSGKLAPPGAGLVPSKNAGAPKGARVVVNKKGMVWDKKAPVTTRA